LAQRGVAVLPPAVPARLEDRVEAAARSGQPVAWAYAPRALDTPTATITRLAALAQARGGSLSAVVVAAPVAEVIDNLTVRALRRGRTNQQSFPTVKTVNYLPPLRRWQEGLGPHAVTVVLPPAQARAARVSALVWGALGLPGPSPVRVPRGTPLRPPLAPAPAEALRRANVVLTGPRHEQARHQAFRRAVALSREQGAATQFVLPVADVADLSAAMATEASTVLADVPPDERARLFLPRSNPSVSEQQVDAAWQALRQDPGLREVLPATSHDLVSLQDQLRSHVQVLTRAAPQDDPTTVARVAGEVQRLILADPATRVLGRHEPEVPIPGRCYQYWEPLPPPDYMTAWIRSWDEVALPGRGRLVSRDEARTLLEQVAGPAGAAAFDLAANPAMRSDLYRYAALVQHGGWYVDAEHEATAPLEWALPVRRAHLLVVRPDGKFTSSFLGAAPGSPLAASVLEEAVVRVTRTGGKGGNMTVAGPALLTQMAKRYLASPEANALVIPRRVAFHSVLQQIHHSAAYKVSDYWRDLQLGST
jgi:mannosyltransferase OCH1-like enzyme